MPQSRYAVGLSIPGIPSILLSSNCIVAKHLGQGLRMRTVVSIIDTVLSVSM